MSRPRRHNKEQNMRHFLTDKVRLVQIVLRLSILWAWAGAAAMAATPSHSQSWTNGSWQWARSPTSCSPEGRRHARCGIGHTDTRPDKAGGVSGERDSAFLNRSGSMLVAPVGGSNGVSRGSAGSGTPIKISNLLIPQPTQSNSSPVRSAN